MQLVALVRQPRSIAAYGNDWTLAVTTSHGWPFGVGRPSPQPNARMWAQYAQIAGVDAQAPPSYAGGGVGSTGGGDGGVVQLATIVASVRQSSHLTRLSAA